MSKKRVFQSLGIMLIIAISILNISCKDLGETGVPIATPALNSPADNATNISIPVTVSWDTTKEASNYSLQVSTEIGFGSFIYNQSGITGISQQISGLANSTTYYWRVNASNSSGTSGWSIVRSFTTSGIEPPTLNLPVDNAANLSIPVTVSWVTAIGASNYSLQVSTDNGFVSYIFNQSGITGISQQISGLANSTTYYWRVNASNSAGTSGWSSVRNFTTTKIVSQNITMIQVLGGTFQMGQAGTQGEAVHSVTLANYYISQTEVTQGQWQAVMGNNPSVYSLVGPTGPVEGVNWYICISFCNKLSVNEGKTPCYSINGNTNPPNWTSGTIVCNFNANGYRLPTEAEWEYAAKGGNLMSAPPYMYSGNNLVGNVAWFFNNSGGTTHTVGGKQENELGLVDMSGNVQEWCWDWYGSYGYGAQTDPTGPSSGSYRLLRGGSWNDNYNICYVTYRSNNNPIYSYGNNGLRLVRR